MWAASDNEAQGEPLLQGTTTLEPPPIMQRLAFMHMRSWNSTMSRLADVRKRAQRSLMSALRIVGIGGRCPCSSECDSNGAPVSPLMGGREVHSQRFGVGEGLE